MDNKPRVILVTGATGKQGAAVVKSILRSYPGRFYVLGLTRKIESFKAQSLIQICHGSETLRLVEGDLDDVPNVFAEARRVVKAEVNPDCDDIWGVFSVQVSMGKGVTAESEISQGKALVDESIRNGVSHFVYSSVERGGDEASWNNQTPIPHFQSKYHIEHYLRHQAAAAGGKMGWTILRPVAFMDNLTPGFATQVFVTALHNWLGDKPLQWVATTDIGVFAAKAFAYPEAWNGRAMGIAGDELTFEQMDDVFDKITGDNVPTTISLLGSALTWLSAELRLMIGWFASDGYRADIQACRDEYPQMSTMERWLVKDSPFEVILDDWDDDEEEEEEEEEGPTAFERVYGVV
ncbi:NAD(P)-binding protein [Poronia punctata]|nr:NAD(P)-binding protein [Poronia punctata]